MKSRHILLFFLIISFQSLMGNQNSFEESSFAKGYFISKLEDRFPLEKIELDVRNQEIIVYEYPTNIELCREIQFYLENFSDYTIVFDRTYIPEQNIISEGNVGFNVSPPLEGIRGEESLLPELSPFFPTMLAQPHIIGYSAGYRTYDKIFRIGVLPVSIGDQFSLYQFKTCYGRLYVGIEACVWAIFEARAKSLSLINADYYVAIPLTYINDNFAARLRVFHESSHLGDEFLLENRKITRLNPSMEVVDLSLAYNFSDRLEAFVGYSYVFRSDDSYKIKPNSVYYGFNYFLDFWKINFCNLEATPYVATYFCNAQDNHWHLDSSFALGYQWDKLYGHKLRIYLEGHTGFSAEGQFSKRRTEYLAIKLFYGY